MFLVFLFCFWLANEDTPLINDQCDSDQACSGGPQDTTCDFIFSIIHGSRAPLSPSSLSFIFCMDPGMFRRHISLRGIFYRLRNG